MSSVYTYNDFLLATKPHKITPDTDILMDAVSQTYALKEMLRGTDASMVIKGGKYFIDQIMLDNVGSGSWIGPNVTVNLNDVDSLREVRYDWRWGMSKYGFDNKVIGINEGSAPGDRFTKMRKAKEIQLKEDMIQLLENALWAVPDATTMEQGSTSPNPPPMSISCFVNENANGLWSGFTTVGGINPATFSRWVPQQGTYNAGSPNDDITGLLASFDDMWLKVDFESPGSVQDYAENDTLRKMKILTNADGMKIYQRILRARNDILLGGRQDGAYPEPVYRGIPLKYIKKLDTALLDPTTGAAWASGRPRYLWLNFKYLFPVFHSEEYMKISDPMPVGATMPNSFGVFCTTYMNLFCRSRQRQGIVYPA